MTDFSTMTEVVGLISPLPQRKNGLHPPFFSRKKYFFEISVSSTFRECANLPDQKLKKDQNLKFLKFMREKKDKGANYRYSR